MEGARWLNNRGSEVFNGGSETAPWRKQCGSTKEARWLGGGAPYWYEAHPQVQIQSLTRQQQTVSS